MTLTVSQYLVSPPTSPVALSDAASNFGTVVNGVFVPTVYANVSTVTATGCTLEQFTALGKIYTLLGCTFIPSLVNNVFSLSAAKVPSVASTYKVNLADTSPNIAANFATLVSANIVSFNLFDRNIDFNRFFTLTPFQYNYLVTNFENTNLFALLFSGGYGGNRRDFFVLEDTLNNWRQSSLNFPGIVLVPVDILFQGFNEKTLSINEYYYITYVSSDNETVMVGNYISFCNTVEFEKLYIFTQNNKRVIECHSFYQIVVDLKTNFTPEILSHLQITNAYKRHKFYPASFVQISPTDPIDIVTFNLFSQYCPLRNCILKDSADSLVKQINGTKDSKGVSFVTPTNCSIAQLKFLSDYPSTVRGDLKVFPYKLINCSIVDSASNILQNISFISQNISSIDTITSNDALYLSFDQLSSNLPKFTQLTQLNILDYSTPIKNNIHSIITNISRIQSVASKDAMLSITAAENTSIAPYLTKFLIKFVISDTSDNILSAANFPSILSNSKIVSLGASYLTVSADQLSAVMASSFYTNVPDQQYVVVDSAAKVLSNFDSILKNIANISSISSEALTLTVSKFTSAKSNASKFQHSLAVADTGYNVSENITTLTGVGALTVTNANVSQYIKIITAFPTASISIADTSDNLAAFVSQNTSLGITSISVTSEANLYGAPVYTGAPALKLTSTQFFSISALQGLLPSYTVQFVTLFPGGLLIPFSNALTCTSSTTSLSLIGGVFQGIPGTTYTVTGSNSVISHSETYTTLNNISQIYGTIPALQVSWENLGYAAGSLSYGSTTQSFTNAVTASVSLESFFSSVATSTSASTYSVPLLITLNGVTATANVTVTGFNVPTPIVRYTPDLKSGVQLSISNVADVYQPFTTSISLNGSARSGTYVPNATGSIIVTNTGSYSDSALASLRPFTFSQANITQNLGTLTITWTGTAPTVSIASSLGTWPQTSMGLLSIDIDNAWLKQTVTFSITTSDFYDFNIGSIFLKAYLIPTPSVTVSATNVPGELSFAIDAGASKYADFYYSIVYQNITFTRIKSPYVVRGLTPGLPVNFDIYTVGSFETKSTRVRATPAVAVNLKITTDAKLLFSWSGAAGNVLRNGVLLPVTAINVNSCSYRLQDGDEAWWSTPTFQLQCGEKMFDFPAIETGVFLVAEPTVTLSATGVSGQLKVVISPAASTVYDDALYTVTYSTSQSYQTSSSTSYINGLIDGVACSVTVEAVGKTYGYSKSSITVSATPTTFLTSSIKISQPLSTQIILFKWVDTVGLYNVSILDTLGNTLATAMATSSISIPFLDSYVSSTSFVFQYQLSSTSPVVSSSITFTASPASVPLPVVTYANFTDKLTLYFAKQTLPNMDAFTYIMKGDAYEPGSSKDVRGLQDGASYFYTIQTKGLTFGATQEITLTVKRVPAYNLSVVLGDAGLVFTWTTRLAYASILLNDVIVASGKNTTTVTYLPDSSIYETTPTFKLSGQVSGSTPVFDTVFPEYFVPVRPPVPTISLSTGTSGSVFVELGTANNTGGGAYYYSVTYVESS